MKKALINFSLVIFSILLTWLFLEGIASVYLLTTCYDKAIGRWEFRSSCPLPYKDAPYFNSDFIKESSECAVSSKPSPGSPVSYPGDFTGKYFNVKNGLRKTMYQPEVFSNKILLFGSSTVFCQEVPDAYTIASYLQKLVNLNGKSFLVENHGGIAITVGIQTIALLQTRLSPGDIVIFYDGGTDIVYPIYHYHATLRGADSWDHSHGAKKLTPLQKIILPWAIKFQSRSSIARIILKRIEYQPAFAIADKETLEQDLSNEQNIYSWSLKTANDYVKKSGGLFYHFLQPSIYTFSEHTPYEKEVIANDLKQIPGMDIAFHKAYPRFRVAMNEAERSGVMSFDLSGILKERKRGVEYFLDSFHVNHLANEIIAQKIYDCIFGRI